jgi:phosphoribosylanthranilate isomerase
MFLSDDDRIHLKICGITKLNHARFVSGALTDFVGFIFVKESPRYIQPAEAGAIVSWLEGPKCVGVFKDQPLDEVKNTIIQTGVTVAQLHGNESPAYCAGLDVEIIKVFSVEATTTRQDLEEAIEPYLNVVDYLLFDTKVGHTSGGTGAAFDWSIVNEITEEIPFFIAGGVSADNIEQIMEEARPFGIDVNSTLEYAPGEKDFDLMEVFFERYNSLKYYQ